MSSPSRGTWIEIRSRNFTYAGKSLGEKLSRNKHRLDADGNPLPEDTTISSDSTNIGKG